MTRQRTLDRRRFLWGAAAASVATLTACSPAAEENPSTRRAGRGGGAVRRKGSATKALPQPNTFAEAPMLATQVKAGQLPAVKDRLPAHPYVVPHTGGWTAGSTAASSGC